MRNIKSISLLVLIKRHILLKRRRILETTIECLIPLCVMLLLILAKRYLPNKVIGEVVSRVWFLPTVSTSSYSSSYFVGTFHTIGYTVQPKDPFTVSFVHDVMLLATATAGSSSSSSKSTNVVFFPNKTTLYDHVQPFSDSKMVGVEFTEVSSATCTLAIPEV